MDVGKSRAILPVFAGAGSYEIRLSFDEISVDLSMFEQLEDRPSVTYWPTSATSLVPMPTSSRYKKIIQRTIPCRFSTTVAARFPFYGRK